MSNKYLDIAMEKVIKQEVNKVLDKTRAEIKALTDGVEPERIWNVDVFQIIDKNKEEGGGEE